MQFATKTIHTFSLLARSCLYLLCYEGYALQDYQLNASGAFKAYLTCDIRMSTEIFFLKCLSLKQWSLRIMYTFGPIIFVLIIKVS